MSNSTGKRITDDAAKQMMWKASEIALRRVKNQTGAANGIAPLDAYGRVPLSHLPASQQGEMFVYFDRMETSITAIQAGSSESSESEGYKVAYSTSQNQFFLVEDDGIHTGGAATALQGYPLWLESDMVKFGTVGPGSVIPYTGKVYVCRKDNSTWVWDGSKLASFDFGSEAVAALQTEIVGLKSKNTEQDAKITTLETAADSPIEGMRIYTDKGMIEMPAPKSGTFRKGANLERDLRVEVNEDGELLCRFSSPVGKDECMMILSYGSVRNRYRVRDTEGAVVPTVGYGVTKLYPDVNGGIQSYQPTRRWHRSALRDTDTGTELLLPEGANEQCISSLSFPGWMTAVKVKQRTRISKARGSKLRIDPGECVKIPFGIASYKFCHYDSKKGRGYYRTSSVARFYMRWTWIEGQDSPFFGLETK